ncbi:MAG TPA: hypothetical protein VIV65_02575 [Gemmatimonadaceae bacterium]|jgi:hypothetical protein
MQSQVQGTSPGVLRAQIVEAQATLEGMKAELAQLDAQLKAAPARANVIQARASEVNLDMARVQGELARLEAALNLQGDVGRNRGGTTQVPAPHVRFLDRFNSDQMFAFTMVMAVALLFPFSVALARRVWRGGARPDPGTTLVASRLERLEQSVDAIAIEVERISEGQRFVTKVIAEQQTVPRIGSEK